MIHNLIYFSKKNSKYYLLNDKKVCDGCGDLLPLNAVYKVLHHTNRGTVKIYCHFCYGNAIKTETEWESINFISLMSGDKLPKDAIRIIDPSVRVQYSKSYSDTLVKNKKMVEQESNTTKDNRVYSIGYEQRQNDMQHIAHNKSECVGVMIEDKTTTAEIGNYLLDTKLNKDKLIVPKD